MNDVRAHVGEILKIRGMSGPAIDKWWETPLIGLGGQTPTEALETNPERVIGTAQMIQMPKPKAKPQPKKLDPTVVARRRIKTLESSLRNVQADLAAANEKLRASRNP